MVTSTPPDSAPSDPGPKRMRLRYTGRCEVCDAPLAAKSEAWYDPGRKKVRCVGCVPSATGNGEKPPVTHTAAAEMLPAMAPVDARPANPVVLHAAGMAGASARREYERRKASDDARSDARERSVRARHPRIGGLLIALADNRKERQSTAAWRVGAVGEVAVGKRLDDWAASSGGYVLHDRRIPGTRANIDHMAIGASGVWVIDAKLYTTGRVEHVDRGGWSRSDWRLTVGGRDQSKLASGVLKQMGTVAAVLNDGAGGVAGPEIHGMLCFVAADWRFFARPFVHAGVNVGWPVAMVQLVGEPGPDGPSAWKTTAAVLARMFPSA